MSGEGVFFNSITPPSSSSGKLQDRDTLYVKELLKEKHKQLQNQLTKIKNPSQANFVQDKINTIQKLLSYQEVKTQNKNIGISGTSSTS